ncbi:hypothetical protein DW1_2068 [Proteiniborus sp. DW1]|uniref:hypothetical protein n=1 Tax=Proteiniborus sp. DW1 TaxID=1889883 RepID=UPI00092DF348|nr:hypothetical protein [Proteiniborus sp. DW1]SCG83635.1 hypothetical protein DW1_2068 [Proteiniborus sp. DW1]
MKDFEFNDCKKEAEENKINSAKKYSLELTKKSLLDGIIMSEILGHPKGRKGLMYNVHKSINSR